MKYSVSRQKGLEKICRQDEFPVDLMNGVLRAVENTEDANKRTGNNHK